MTFETTSQYVEALAQDPTLAILPLQMVADHRGVTRAAVDRMVRIGQLEEIRIDGNRYVRASSLFSRQQAREQQIRTVRAFLEKHAREQSHGAREPLTYEPVMDLVGLSPSIPADRTTIGAILGAILERTWAEHRVLLTVIVHRKTQGRTRPGPGFFAIAQTLGGLEPWDDKDELVERETAKVWAFYAAAPSPDSLDLAPLPISAPSTPSEANLQMGSTAGTIA